LRSGVLREIPGSIKAGQTMEAILFYINTFFPVVGGAQTQCLVLAKELLRRGIPVRIATRMIPGERSGDTRDGIPVKRLFCAGGRCLRALTFCASSLLFFFRNAARFGTIQTFQMDSNAFTACLAGLILRKKVFVRIAGSGVTGEISTHDSAAKRLMLRFIRRYASGFLVLNGESKNDLLSLDVPAEKICLLRNGVDASKHHPAAENEKQALRKKKGLENRFIALFAGRLVKGKRVDVLLSAWKLCADGKSALLILGDGPEKNSLMEKIRQEKIASVNIEFSDSIGDYYDMCDVFLLPSDAEGTPNSLLEAMAHGKACIGSKIPGITEIIRDGENGLLCERTPEDIAGKIRMIRDDPALARLLGKKAAETVREKFTIEKVADVYLDFIQKNI
jgi:glycosyltransferase involved in cell wall biosynthesis